MLLTEVNEAQKRMPISVDFDLKRE